MILRPHLCILAFCFTFLLNSAWAQKKCPKVENLAADGITETSADLSWEGSDDHKVYQISVKHQGGSSPFKYDTETDGTSLTVYGLSPGNAYRFQVKAKCEQGSSGASGWYAFDTPGDPEAGGDSTESKGRCPKASNLAVLDVTDTTVTLSWLGNEENIAYRVDVHQKEHTPQFRLSEIVDTTILEVEGLVPGGNYKFRVKADCDKNSAGSSSWINFTTTGGDTTFNNCPKPTNLSVLEVTDSSALLTWIARDSVDEFMIDVKSFEQTPSFSLSETTEDTFYLVEGLAPEGNYQFRVVATCKDGSTSGSSDWSKFRTLPKADTTDGNGMEEPVDTPAVAPLVTFPNPVAETLIVDLPEEDLGFVTYILLSDINGRIVYNEILEGTVKAEQVRIPMQDLSNGLYKLQVRSTGYLETKTILVQH